MKSRTSFFNKTVLLKDITRFCPVWIIYTILYFMTSFSTMTIGLFDSGQMAYDVAYSTTASAIINLIYAIVCAIFLFGDLFKSRLCNALHAFPIRRESWFATHMLAGLLFFLVPNVILALIYTSLLGKLWFIGLLWLLATTVQFLFYFALAALCVMLTGSRFAATVVYLILNFLSVLCYWFVYTYYAPMLTGLHIRDTLFLLFCPVAYLSTHELFAFREVAVNVGIDFYWSYAYEGLTNVWWYIAVIGGLALVMIALAVLLYRKRALECAGDFLAFRKPMPVFLVLFALTIGAVFQTIFGLMDSNVISMVIGLVVGCYAGQMLLRRTIRVFDKRSLLFCGSLVGALALTLLLTFIDPLGVTRWTPEPDEVDSIILSDSYEYAYGDELYSYANTITITDPEQIKTLISIHDQLIDEHEIPDAQYLYMYNSNIHSVHLTYKMTDGRVVERRYYFANNAIQKQLNVFFSAPEFVLHYEDWDSFVSDVQTVYLNGDPLTTATYLTLLDAVKADCEAGTMAQDQDYFLDTGHYIQIETEEQFISLVVYEGCTNTLKWIKERQNAS